jgi:methylenetetrahydrofolate reductase (NADPH)
VGKYRSASELLEVLADRRDGFGRIGVAGYPEKHPIVNEGELLKALLTKQPHADYIVSQICFDPAVVFAWIDVIRRRGIHLPVYIGMPGPLKRRKLLEVAMRVGVGDSIRFIAGKGSLVTRLAFRRAYRPDAFVARVASLLGGAEQGIAGLHLNTFNQVEPAERWRQRALAAYGWPEAPA